MKYKELIDKMTLDEKVSLLSGRNFWQTKSVDRLNIPSMTMADGPHGLRKQDADADHLGLNAGVPATCFPTSATIANSWDVKLGETIGAAIGREAKYQDVNILLGPGLNIKRSPLCGRNFEYFSEDPFLSGKMAAGYIRGIQSQGVAGCPKHFVANNQELFRMSNDSVVDKRTLYEIYLTGFEIAVKESKPRALMSAYNMVNGVYANESEELLRDILVEQWGFDGLVVSDWGGSNDHTDGVRAGSHLEMPATGGDSDRQLKAAVESGKLSIEALDERVDEYLRVLFDLQFDDRGEKPDFELQNDIAKEAAESSIVLLKNENGILPLDRSKKLAIIGPFAEKPRYQGAGSSLVNPAKLSSTIDSLPHTDMKITGFEDGQHVERAVKLAGESDIVLLYLGLDDASETEGMDRDHLSIGCNQINLLNRLEDINKNIVVVLSGGSVIEMPWIDKCRAVVHGYLSGQAGADAMLSILTGKSNPSGKLSESYPLKLEDTPVHNYYPGRERTSEYREGIFVGYRYYDIANVEIRFPFGFGLSYTTFEYSELKITDNDVTFKVTNTGDIDGAEVVQLYIGITSKKVFRPSKELKGFDKIFLKSGESKSVNIKFDDKSFRYFNIEKDQFEIESGEYSIYIGASSTDIRLKGSLLVNGVEDVIEYDKALYKNYYNGDVKNISDDTFETLLGHDIPVADWDRTAMLGRNDSIAQMEYAKSGFARIIFKIIKSLKNRSIKKGQPNLNILFIYHIPFRGIEKLMGEFVSQDMVNGILNIVNGRFFKGLGQFVKGHRAVMSYKKEAKEKNI